MANKPFSPSLFKENDTLARAAGKRYWRSQGYIAEDNPDRYGPDLIVDTGLQKFYSEVEIKRVWSGKEFQYETLQIPERKRKFIGLDMPCAFIVFNNEQTYGYLCTDSQLAVSPVVEVSNKYMRSGENFFKIPVNTLTLVEVPSEEI
jgi:hypothetical protein